MADAALEPLPDVGKATTDVRNRIRGGFVSMASGGQQGREAMYLGIGGLILLIIVLIILFR
jgi:hypothetical protein